MTFPTNLNAEADKSSLRNDKLPNYLLSDETKSSFPLNITNDTVSARLLPLLICVNFVSILQDLF